MGTMSLFVDGMSCRRCVGKSRDVCETSPAYRRWSSICADPSSVSPAMTADDVLGAFASLTYRPRLLNDLPFNG